MSKVRFSRIGLDALFSQVKTGDVHSFSVLDKGSMPLVSCKTEKTPDHGVEGYYDLSNVPIYEKCVTITCDGDQPSTAFYHPYHFAAMDNVLVCVPRPEIRLTTIFYFISYLNRQRWRFSYGRKCYQNKTSKLTAVFPVNEKGEIDQDYIETLLHHATIQMFMPKRNILSEIKVELKLALVPLTDFFDLHSGDYHNASILPDGDIPLVSCGENFNGIVRFCSVPEDKIYANTLTIAYNGQPLTTSLHLYRFAAKDDVAVCLPKKQWNLTTLIYIEYMLNREKWRYSYGRKCFNEKLKKTSMSVPITSDGEIDEKTIEHLVTNTTYWTYLQPNLTIAKTD